MEILGLFEFPLWMILIVCCGLLLYIYGKYPGTIWKSLGVQSPPAAPFFGHVHVLFDSSQGMCKTLRKWEKQYGKIFGTIFFRQPVLVVTDLDALKEIFVKDSNNYTDHYISGGEFLLQPLMKKSIFFSEGQDWKRLRQIMSPTFSSSKLKLLTDYINVTSQQLVNVLHQHAESGANLEAKIVFSAFALDVLAGTAFGVELNSQINPENAFFTHAKHMTTVKKSVKFLMAAAGVFPILGNILKILNLGFIDYYDLQFFREQLTILVNERRTNPEQIDFLQLLINAEVDSESDINGGKKLTTEEIIAQGIIFIYAGYHSTSTTLQWLSYELARNKDVQYKLRKEIEDVVGGKEKVEYEHCQRLKYTEAVINEILRMYPPVHMLTRLVKKESVLKGIPVPSGAAIIMPVHNIGRDPELYEDPDTFDPDRFFMNQDRTDGMAFLPFGLGPRQCIGIRLAMMQLKIAVVHMLRAVSIEDAYPKDLEFEDFSGFLIPKSPVQLIVKDI